MYTYYENLHPYAKIDTNCLSLCVMKVYAMLFAKHFFSHVTDCQSVFLVDSVLSSTTITHRHYFSDFVPRFPLALHLAVWLCVFISVHASTNRHIRCERQSYSKLLYRCFDSRWGEYVLSNVYPHSPTIIRYYLWIFTYFTVTAICCHHHRIYPSGTM